MSMCVSPSKCGTTCRVDGFLMLAKFDVDIYKYLGLTERGLGQGRLSFDLGLTQAELWLNLGWTVRAEPKKV